MPRWGQRAVAQRIREAREAAGFSVAEMAERLQISKPTLYRYETGNRNPEPEILRRIAVLTGRDPTDFYAFSDEERAEQLTANLLAILDLAMEGMRPGEALKEVSPASPVTPRELTRLNRRGPLLREYLDQTARRDYGRDWAALSPEERLDLVDRIAHEARLSAEHGPELP